MTLLGTCLVVGLSPGNLNNLDFASILFGLGSGLGYALYSIFSKYSLQKYSSLQVTSFTFIVAAVTLLPFFHIRKSSHCCSMQQLYSMQ